MARNRLTFYEQVDSYEVEVNRKCKCAICQKELVKGDIVQKVHYCQLGGFLIQHKRMCLSHTAPHIYRAGVGFQKEETNQQPCQSAQTSK